MEKIHLNNSVQDPTYLNEIIARELFNAAGVPVPKATHATVTLNAKDRGLYVDLTGQPPSAPGSEIAIRISGDREGYPKSLRTG